MLWDFLEYSFAGLFQRSLRSVLTILGIVIGISSIVILISLGQGIQQSVNNELESFGTHTIIVAPGNLQSMANAASGHGATTGKLYESDLERLKRVEGINLMTPVLMSRSNIEYKGQTLQAGIMGIEPLNYQSTVSNIEIAQGRFIAPSDRQALVIGDKISKDTFDKDLVTNSVVTINGKKFRVVGVMKRTGGTLDDTDTTIYATIDDVRELVKSTLAKNELSYIYIEIKESYDPKVAAEEVKLELRNAHKVKEGDEDFTLITSDFLQERIGMITGFITAFLGGVAAISLLAGGITIANTMFMAVLERYREIGTLKAIGAKKAQIMQIFLVESGLIGLVGGVTGCLFGLLVVTIANFFGVPTKTTPELLGFALLFSCVVGIVSGYVPAKNAAELDPVVALRYE
jgi:putative ABC transport system permease protein